MDFILGLPAPNGIRPELLPSSFLLYSFAPKEKGGDEETKALTGRGIAILSS